MSPSPVRSRRGAAAFLVCLGLSAGITIAAPAQTAVAGRSALDALPADTTFVLRIRDCADFTSRFKSTPVYALREHPAYKPFIDGAWSQVEKGLGEIRTELGFDPMELVAAVEGEVILAVGGLDKLIQAVSMATLGGAEPDVKPGDLPILVEFDAEASAPKVEEYVAKIVDFMQKKGAAKKDEEFQGGTVTAVTNPYASGSDDVASFFIGRHGSRWFLAVNREFLLAAMAGLGGSGEGSLSSTPDFVATHQALGSGEDLLVFANAKAIMDAVRKNIQNNPIGAMFWGLLENKILGRQLRNIGAALSVRSDGIHDAFLVNTGGSRDGIFGIMDGPGFSPGNPGPIPADALQFSRSSIDFGRFYGIIKDFANMALSFSGQPGADFEQFVELNFQIKIREIIDALGSDLTMVVKKAQGANPSPIAAQIGGDLTISLALRKEAPIRNLLNQLGILTGGAIRAEKYLEKDLYLLDPQSGDASPGIAIAGNTLVFGLSQDSVKGILRRQGKDASGTLSARPLYRELTAGFPDGLVGLSYSGPESLKQSLDVFAEAAGAGGVALPDLTPLVETFGGSASFARWTGAGLFGKGVIKFKSASASR